MLQNLTIGKRLSAGYATVLMLLSLMTVIATIQVRSVEANLAAINQKNSVKQRYAINFRGSVHDRAIGLRDVILADDAEIGDIVDHIGQLTRKYEASATPMDTMLRPQNDPDPQEVAILASIKETEQRTAPIIDRVIKLRRNGQNGEAHALLMAKARPEFVNWLKQINQFIDLEEAKNKSIGETVASQIANFQIIMAGLWVAALLIGLLVIRWSTKSLRVLPRMIEALRAITGGRHDAEVPTAPPGSEMGELGQALHLFRDAAAAKRRAEHDQNVVVTNLGDALRRIASGDLTLRLNDPFPGHYDTLRLDINAAVTSIAETLTAVSRSVATINSTTTEINDGSDDLCQRTEQQAASLEETAAAMDEITSTVRQTATGAATANEVVAAARNDAAEGSEVVQRAIDAMSGIERASSEIGEIISVIDGIAFQTNLLALNAGVEAARAGDAGKGFAVVASEVRALAQRSADAAKDVKTRINASSGEVQQGVDLVADTGRALKRIGERITDISNLMSTIASGAEQQSTGLQQVNTAIGEMDAVTQHNAAMVEKSTVSTRELAAETNNLMQYVARFQLPQGTLSPIRVGAVQRIRLLDRDAA